MAETERLDLFVRRVEELYERRLIKSGSLRAQMNMSAKLHEPVTFTSLQPDEEDLRSFLLTFRQFVSKKECIFVGTIYNILWLHLDSDELKSHLAQSLKQYMQIRKSGSMNFTVNDETLEPWFILDCLINGKYFHNDQRKAKVLDRLDPLGQMFTFNILMDHLIEATRYITYLANMIITGRKEAVLHI